jgi:imidazolonepropionase-like amidohydrolase
MLHPRWATPASQTFHMLVPHLRRHSDVLLTLAVAALVPALAGAQQALSKPQLHVLRKVKLGLAADAREATLVLRDGRIEQLLDPAAQEPTGARIVEGAGLIAVPAFIDAFTGAGCVTGEPKVDRDLPVATSSDVAIEMRAANRKGIQPAFRAALAFDLAKDKAKGYRESGFGALLSAPQGQILAGTSCLATTREAAARDAIAASDVFLHGGFQASGDGYPSTLMGYQAQLRQALLDARWQRELEQRYEAGRPGLRPPFDADLAALNAWLDGGKPFACQASRSTDVERWLALGREFGFRALITGGREAWRLRERLAGEGVAVALVLDWGEEVPDPDKAEKEKEQAKQPAQDAPKEEPAKEPPPADAPAPEAAKPAEKPAAKSPPAAYEEPLEVRRERRRRWEETRDCALRLHEAGVRFAFGSGGGTPAELLKKARTLVELGLPEQAALEALTGEAARITGSERRLGEIAEGRDATLALWTKSPFQKGARLAWLFVDGYSYEFEAKEEAESGAPPDEGVDATGTWELTIQSGETTRRGTAKINMEKSGETKATIESEGFQGAMTTVEYEGRVSGKTLTLRGTLFRRDMEIESKIKVELSGDTFTGTQTSGGRFGERTSTVQGTRQPKGQVEEALR